ncbi:TetR family transcriptional regulator [Gordonia sp. JH63]|jgi:DNA-binding transcriptional regulator YbjK|uniref:TetR family transcriptional regulator n=1 Tax=Gordonia hongkongensis TaxID=1701090 RepID=A0AAX3T2J0_9ACTN|nr:MULTISPECIES: TetR/AcrR family transcriptional regulator [Gordonia]OCW84167.1 TetR family transcriptional regulator [Nocardia farcinica]QIK47632.1 TetR family transcriptional regulator [Gordonia terrae]MBN0971711.1 TetR family transcriptional regulator [Gordonia sp. BP-119]MBN0981155.1 TetR family transcriptional regulator [Gordonia sp. BP-94]MCT1354841.1 TetR family transcriptional regulator [Gordonia sp. p3-SID1431]
MSADSTSGGGRRDVIADAGIRIIARDGVRALTHRAVDREARLPLGSTSYHARTRIALIELIVDALAARTRIDTEALVMTDEGVDHDGRVPVDELAGSLSELVDTLAARHDDMRARYALILELDDLPAIRQRLTGRSDVEDVARLVATRSLAGAGLPNSGVEVEDLLAITDSLVFYRTAINPAVDIRRILDQYLRGAIVG